MRGAWAGHIDGYNSQMATPVVRLILMLAACVSLLAGTARSQTIVRSFDGDSGPGAEVCDAGRTHCGWADMNVGVNGKQVVQVTWQNVRVYDYTGTQLRSTPLETFIV